MRDNFQECIGYSIFCLFRLVQDGVGNAIERLFIQGIELMEFFFLLRGLHHEIPPLWFFGRPIHNNKLERGFVTRICKKRKDHP